MTPIPPPPMAAKLERVGDGYLVYRRNDLDTPTGTLAREGAEWVARPAASQPKHFRLLAEAVDWLVK